MELLRKAMAFSLLFVTTFVPAECNYEVELVTMLFRHGDRTPDTNSLYPRDPYINSTYYPIGIGQLTSKGKRRAFALGQLIRRQYNEFLGSIYFPGQVEAISTDMNRTKASLQLVLAGAFPPRGTKLQWNPYLNWDPIPYNYLSYQDDLWMTITMYFCPKYAKLYEEYLNSPEGKEIMKKNSELYQYLADNTGLNISDPSKAWGVYSCLLSQDEWGYKLPLWTTAVYPDELESATVDALQALIATTEMKQLSGGFMLKKIIDNMNAKANDEIKPENLKLVLYSAHDINILFMSGVLKQPIEHSIPYGSYYIIELVKAYGDHFVQVYANDYITQELTQVTIPGCSFRCPLADFSALLQEYIPTSDDQCTEDIKYVRKYENRRNFYLGKITHNDVVKHFVKEAARLDALDLQGS